MTKLTCLLFPFALIACNSDRMPDYNEERAKEYWQANCQNKPKEIQDKEVCRKALHRWKTDRWK